VLLPSRFELSRFFSREPTRRPGRSWGFVRIGISIGLLWYVARETDFGQIISTFTSTSEWLIVAALISHGLGLLICSLRWSILLRMQGISLPFGDVLRLYWVGCFFNAFLPASVGGDILKVYALGRWSGRNVKVASSVLAERISGILALGAIGGVTASWIAASRWPLEWIYIIAGAVVLSLVPLSLLQRARRAKMFRMRLKGRLSAALNRGVADASESVRLYIDAPSGLIAVMTLSFLLQTVVVIEYYLVAQAIGLHIPLLYFFALIPVVVVASMLPISVGGIGIREGTLVAVLGPLGASSVAAVSTGVWIYLLGVLASLGGGVIYWWRGLLPLSVAGPASGDV